MEHKVVEDAVQEVRAVGELSQTLDKWAGQYGYEPLLRAVALAPEKGKGLSYHQSDRVVVASGTVLALAKLFADD